MKRRKYMADAVAELKELLEPGLLGNYTWIEAVEVIAIPPTAPGGEPRPWNVFSIFVAEVGERPAEPAKFLNERPIKVKGLADWSFGVVRRPMTTQELFDCFERYGRDGVWIPDGKLALQTGILTATSATFCPSDTRTEVAVNAVLKNNFWSGSYLLELKDEFKESLIDLVQDDDLFDHLAEQVAMVLPLNLARVPDRIGDVLVQIPATALIAEFRRRPGAPVELHLGWNPGVRERDVVGEYRVEHDGMISSLARFKFPVGRATLTIPPVSGDLRFSVWDPQKELVLAATSVMHAPDGKGSVESYVSYGVEAPRVFEAKGPADTVEKHTVQLMQSDGSSRVVGHRPPMVDWVAKRELKARVKQLVESKRFLQYGLGNSTREQERRRVLDDIRFLVKLLGSRAAYLWDPFLSANDILNTLAHCEHTVSDLRGLTSSKASKRGFAEDDADDGSDPAATTRREAWIKNQQVQWNNAFTGPSNIKLEFRMSWGNQRGFHDRFLIFPGHGRQRPRAWSLGASINHIGTSHCIVQEVAHAEAVLQAFLAFWNQSNKPEHLIW